MRTAKRLLAVLASLLLLFASAALLCAPCEPAPVFTQRTPSRSYLTAARDTSELVCAATSETPRVERDCAPSREQYRALCAPPAQGCVVLFCAFLLCLRNQSAKGIFSAGKHIQRAPPTLPAVG